MFCVIFYQGNSYERGTGKPAWCAPSADAKALEPPAADVALCVALGLPRCTSADLPPVSTVSVRLTLFAPASEQTMKNGGVFSCLIINDVDAGIGRFRDTQVTVNNQTVVGAHQRASELAGPLRTPRHARRSSRQPLEPASLASCRPVLYLLTWPHDNGLFLTQLSGDSGTLMNLCDHPQKCRRVCCAALRPTHARM